MVIIIVFLLLQSTQQEAASQSSGKTPKKQVLPGGTIMEDLRPGKGLEAKKGKMVTTFEPQHVISNNVAFLQV